MERTALNTFGLAIPEEVWNYIEIHGENNDIAHFHVESILGRKPRIEYPQTDIKVLVIADRLAYLAVGLQLYMKKYTTITVGNICPNIRQDVIEEVGQIDYIIYVGFQNSEESYELTNHLAKQGHRPRSVMWCSYDPLIQYLDSIYHFDIIIDRYGDSVEEFMNLLIAGLPPGVYRKPEK